MITERTDIRNIAIIAHVDHGKTTLVDGLLRQAKVFRENQQVMERVMDSNDLERERGITILAKNTAISIYDTKSKQQVKINIVDTPGHADFGGEVERVLNMVDGVLLLVDAAEGPMPQTRFVLKKALGLGLKAVVVVNKIDRKDAEPVRTLNDTFDLFIELGANDQQADFKIIYSNAVTAQAGLTPDLSPNLEPLFRTILDDIPCPKVALDEPFQMLVANLAYDNFKGQMAIGRIFAGELTAGQSISRIKVDGTLQSEKARYLYTFQGLEKTETERVRAGDIVAIAGLEGVEIGETLADSDNPKQLPPIVVEEPTVKMTFAVNTSPFSGREGKWSTSRKLRDRLFDELKNNVALRVEETESPDTFVVCGRGELHLAILIETMRREGYELQVSRPEAILKTNDNGEITEPFEELHIEVAAEYVGTVVELLGPRRGIMTTMANLSDGSVHMKFIVPTRGLLGFRHQFLTATRGNGVINSIFHKYDTFAGKIPSRSTHSIVAWEDGVSVTYGLKNAEERGTLFIGPGVDIYQGMVVGETQRPSDVIVNVCKKKHLTNMRSSNADIQVRLNTPRSMSLDECVEFLADDELLEVTPVNLRIRKRILNTEDRGKQVHKDKELEESS